MHEQKQRVTYDVECYVNYFLLMICDVESGEILHSFEMYNDERIDHSILDVANAMKRYTLISFNGLRYDDLIVTAYLNGATNAQLKAISDEIINKRMMPWIFERKYSVSIPKWDHIDLIEPSFGAASLKVYGARLGATKLQELPLHHKSLIMPHQLAPMRHYCQNDNIVTGILAKELNGAIKLREEMSREFGIDLRSKSDAQIAEAILASEAQKLGITLKKPNMKTYPKQFKYEPPVFIYFQTDRMKNLLNVTKSLDYKLSPAHKIIKPKELGLVRFYSDDAEGLEIERRLEELGNAEDLQNIKEIKAEIAKLKKRQKELTIKAYNMQIGGLHSKDDRGSHYSDQNYNIFEIDVSSFYPNIIIQSGSYIPSMGKVAFQRIYQGLLNKKNDATTQLRELAKQGVDSGTEYNQLKTTIATVKILSNGTFGKFSNHYSKLYAPNLLISTTLTGQLSLLMLLELFHKEGVHVLSANTDGINVRVTKGEEAYVNSVVKWWCETTGFVMDYNYYKSIHYRDVNNYFTVMPDGKVKGIGIFAGDGIRKSPANSIVRDACFAYVKDGICPWDTIKYCTDITKFLTLKKVTGGAVKDGTPLGATIRWYRSTTTMTPINYESNGNQVAGSTRGVPLMDLPDSIEEICDIDYEFYVYDTYKTLLQCKAEGTNAKFYKCSITNSLYMNPTKLDNLQEIAREDFVHTIGEALEMSKPKIKEIL